MNFFSKLYYKLRKMWKAIQLYLVIAGPGIVVMVADNDAGGITTYAATGAKYGYHLIWFLLILIPVAYYVQEMTVRLGAVTKRGLAEAIFDGFGAFWGWFALVDLMLVNWLTLVTEFIGITMKVSLLGGVVLAFPVIIYQIVMFIAPALKPRERRYLFILMPASLLSFIAGGAFGYKVLIPPAIRFLVNWGSDIATPMIRIGNIVNLMITLLFWMGVIFQMPLVAFFLTKIGIVTPQALARGRRFALVGAFVLAAIITPTFDPINQALVAGPIIVLYELGIWLSYVAKWGQKPRAKKPA